MSERRERAVLGLVGLVCAVGLTAWIWTRAGWIGAGAVALTLIGSWMALYALARVRMGRSLLTWSWRYSGFSWLIGRTPEAALFRDPAQRSAAILAALHGVLPRYQLLMVPGVLVGPGLAWQIARGIQSVVHIVPLMWLFFGLFAFLEGAAVFVGWRLVRAAARRRLRARLVDLGIPVCVRCGYDLTANVSGRCPECGDPALPAARKWTPSPN